MPTNVSSHNDFKPIRLDVTWEAYEVATVPEADEAGTTVPPGKYIIAIDSDRKVLYSLPVPAILDSTGTDLSAAIALITAAALNNATANAATPAHTPDDAPDTAARDDVPTPVLSLLEDQIRAAEARGELPCPFGSNWCTTAGGQWYHGDCKPPTETAEPETAATSANPANPPHPGSQNS